MKKKYLDAEEKEIMASIENDEFVPVTGVELRKVADAIAARKKDMTLTIRVNRNDINRIKKMAQKRKIPYQSYISEVIHRIAQTA
jgi:predicted DNA binding CopG/RHH family protein